MRQIMQFMLLIFLTAAGTSSEARRVALIIGNSDYQQTSILANPANDAKLVAESARRAGFDDITMAVDLEVEPFRNALREFRDKADGAEMAMILFAGHGLEGQGKNWLVPVDAALENSYDLPYEAIELEQVLRTLDGAQLRMVVLDACRNNPFARSWRSDTRAITRGLIGVEADDVLVIYAAAPGQTAADGADDNSPFAASFARRLPQAGVPVQLIGGLVRDDVLSVTEGEQRPFVSMSITGTPVYLVDDPNGANVAQSALPANVGLDENDLDALAWQGALHANSLTAYRNYLEEFPAGQFASLASDNIAKLQGSDQQRGTGFIATALPDSEAVGEGETLPIDGIWTISSNRKRIRIEKGRAFALDPWTHAFVFRVDPGKVVMRDLTRRAPGIYAADDILIPGKTKLRLRADGDLDAQVAGPLFPISYRLIRTTLSDKQAFDAEQALAEEN